VTSVTDGTRTWSYGYDSTSTSALLQTVTLPDSSTWQLGGLVPLLRNVGYYASGACDDPGLMDTATVTGTLTHPSGASGSFTLTPTRHGREGVANLCEHDQTSGAYWAVYPKAFDTYALTRKSISGPGLPTMDWVTTYPTAVSSWAPCSSCACGIYTVMQLRRQRQTRAADRNHRIITT
jgi:hypothetical protein